MIGGASAVAGKCRNGSQLNKHHGPAFRNVEPIGTMIPAPPVDVTTVPAVWPPEVPSSLISGELVDY